MAKMLSGYYADSSACDWRSAVAVIVTLALGVVCWMVCAMLFASIGWALGYPVAGTVIGAFGVPIFGILVNGWCGASHDGEAK